MIKIVCLIAIACLMLSCSNTKKENWISLFNGKDISNWTVKIHHHDVGDNYGNTFRVEDSMIKIRYDQYDEFNDRFGHLYYNTPYSHFKLKFDYRFTGIWRKDAPEYTELNSGVMYHSQDPRTMLKEQDWPISVEFQLLAGLERNTARDEGRGTRDKGNSQLDSLPRPTGNMCSPGTDVVYEGKIDPRHCINSSSKTYFGDQWVHAELIVLGDSLVTHIINGDTVLQYSKPQIGGGVANRYDPKIKIDGKLLKEGYIALQSEGQEIDFKNIRLLNLAKH
jgi:hypothetical protein